MGGQQALRRAATQGSREPQLWRVTTAARVFALALSTGLAVSSQSLGNTGTTLLALAVLAAIMSAMDFDAMAAIAGVPVAEAVLAVLLVAAFGSPEGYLGLYFAVPPLVAGLRHGIVSTTSTVIGELVALLVVANTLAGSERLGASTEESLTWVMVGLGVGLLAARQRRSTRGANDDLAPYLTAHRLLDQLRDLARHLPAGLDTMSIAEDLARSVGSLTHAPTVAVLRAMGGDRLVPFSSSCNDSEAAVDPDDTGLHAVLAGQKAMTLSEPEAAQGLRRIALPLRSRDRALGVVVAEVATSLEPQEVRNLQRLVDGYSIRLETALLFEEVRALATMEERNRLAREIHDGIAQEIASLGYLVDDLAAATENTEGKNAARSLRGELSRIVSELRLSIFDLRVDVRRQGGLGQAISDYARDVGSRCGMSVHVALSGSSDRIPVDAQTELLRIAQEAITNARKHAHANNLWVGLNTNGSVAVLRIEDDGVGEAQPKDDHYGLRMMNERAERIGAELAVTKRPRGGTSVIVALQPPQHTTQGANRANLSIAS